jgi:hypothetical protein
MCRKNKTVKHVLEMQDMRLASICKFSYASCGVVMVSQTSPPHVLGLGGRENTTLHAGRYRSVESMMDIDLQTMQVVERNIFWENNASPGKLLGGKIVGDRSRFFLVGAEHVVGSERIVSQIYESNISSVDSANIDQFACYHGRIHEIGEFTLGSSFIPVVQTNGTIVVYILSHKTTPPYSAVRVASLRLKDSGRPVITEMDVQIVDTTPHNGSPTLSLCKAPPVHLHTPA